MTCSLLSCDVWCVSREMPTASGHMCDPSVHLPRHHLHAESHTIDRRGAGYKTRVELIKSVALGHGH